MKKGINLFTKQKKYLYYEKIFKYIRLLVIGIIVIFFVFFMFFYFFLSKQSKEIDNINNIKKQLLEFVIQNKEVEAKFTYFRSKQNQLNKILAEDVNFYPYYSLINDSLKYASPEPTIETITLDKERNIDFIINLSDVNSAFSFLKFAESDKFLKNFDSLNIAQFSVDESTNSKGYKLTLTGKLNPNEIKN